MKMKRINFHRSKEKSLNWIFVEWMLNEWKSDDFLCNCGGSTAGIFLFYYIFFVFSVSVTSLCQTMANVKQVLWMKFHFHWMRQQSAFEWKTIGIKSTKFGFVYFMHRNKSNAQDSLTHTRKIQREKEERKKLEIAQGDFVAKMIKFPFALNT